MVVLTLAAAVGLTVTMAGPRIVKALVHQRDTGAFHGYVTTYVGGWSSSRDPHGPKRDQRWVARNPDSVLAQGEQACAWLDRQPSAPIVDESGSFSVDTLLRRYLASAEGERSAQLSDMGRRTVVAGAWAYLCWSTREDKTAPMGDESD